MVKWLCGNPSRLPLLLAIYFIAHVLVRTFVSGTLDYDESEQAFLSQFFQLATTASLLSAHVATRNL